jgi:nucleotidyltransferase DUF2204
MRVRPQHRANMRHPTGVPEDSKPLPVSSSERPLFPPEQKLLFREVLEKMNESTIPYVVSGAFALQAHTGIWRDTKDLDLFLEQCHVGGALRQLSADGFECEVCDPVWLAKAHRGDFYVDLITGMSNGVISVDASWIERALPKPVMGVPTRVLGAEELIASKLFVTRRERFDGADICHVIHGTRGKLDWQRILGIVGEHWEVVLWSLQLFHYIYPQHAHYVPAEIWDDLLGRFQRELRDGSKAPFRGSLIDENMFAIDVCEWGFDNELARYRERRLTHAETCDIDCEEPAA